MTVGQITKDISLGFCELSYLLGDFVDAPFDGREYPELKVVYAHLTVYQIDNLYRQRNRCQLDHQEAPFLTGKHRNDYGNGNYQNEYGVNEFCLKFRRAADFAYYCPDAFFFLLKVLQFLLQVVDFVLMIFVLLVHDYPFI
jgi:hypothetical protein